MPVFTKAELNFRPKGVWRVPPSKYKGRKIIGTESIRKRGNIAELSALPQLPESRPKIPLVNSLPGEKHPIAGGSMAQRGVYTNHTR